MRKKQEGNISIHALRKESDRQHQSGDRQHQISIHALRKESDGVDPFDADRFSDFNPRSP